MLVATTERLTLRWLELSDAGFMLVLVNDPGWIRFIGRREVHNIDDARRYLERGALAMYAQHGHGLYCVDRNSDRATLGICGLVRREGLDDIDLGFAFLPEHTGQGYALEAARATLDHAWRQLRLARTVAITSKDNQRSIALLQKLGYRHHGTVVLPRDTEEIVLHLRLAPEASIAQM